MTADKIAAMTAESIKNEKIAKIIDGIVSKCEAAAANGEWEIKIPVNASTAEKELVYAKLHAMGYELTIEEDGELTVEWKDARPELPQIRFRNEGGCIVFDDCDGERQVLFPPFSISGLCVEHGPSRQADGGEIKRLALYANGDVFELAKDEDGSLSKMQMNLLSETAQAELLTAMNPKKG